MPGIQKYGPCIIGLSLLLACTFTPERKIIVYLVGDSTMCNYETSQSPLTGWGMPFRYFFDSTVTIDNRARGGRSSRTFISHELWQPIANNLREGDYVFIQFGHNDEAKGEEFKEYYTPVAEYKTNLIKFITETRLQKATPVLITPVTRMRFDKEGNIEETHKEYSAAVWEAGNQYNTPVIDLDKKSRELLQQLGPVFSKMLFMQLDTLQHPNYPNGRKDSIHLNEYGARRMAEIVLAEIRDLKLELVDHIIKR